MTLHPWYTPDDIARLVGCSRRTIIRWCDQRRIPHMRVGRLIRFTDAQWREVEAAYRVEPEPVIDVNAPNPDYAPDKAIVVPMRRRA